MIEDPDKLQIIVDEQVRPFTETGVSMPELQEGIQNYEPFEPDEEEPDEEEPDELEEEPEPEPAESEEAAPEPPQEAVEPSKVPQMQSAVKAFLSSKEKPAGIQKYIGRRTKY